MILLMTLARSLATLLSCHPQNPLTPKSMKASGLMTRYQIMCGIIYLLSGDERLAYQKVVNR